MNEACPHAMQIEFAVPVLGLCAYSGTGKTHLLRQLLPLLRAQQLRVGVVKHAHHNFEIDHAGKDSAVLREAGASQMAIASNNCLAFIEDRDISAPAPSLQQALALLQPERLDMVIAEGFKQAAIDKIELHRPALGADLMCNTDKHVIALATDTSVKPARHVTQLDLNDVPQIGVFIAQWYEQVKGRAAEKIAKP